MLLPFVSVRPQGGDVELPRTNLTGFSEYFRALHACFPGEHLAEPRGERRIPGRGERARGGEELRGLADDLARAAHADRAVGDDERAQSNLVGGVQTPGGLASEQPHLGLEVELRNAVRDTRGLENRRLQCHVG